MNNVYAHTEAIADEKSQIIKNGQEVLDNDERQNILTEIHQAYVKVPAKDQEREIFLPIGEKYFCIVFHPIKDRSGRTRPCVFVWDKNATQGDLTATAQAIGVDIHKLKALENTYQSRGKYIRLFDRYGTPVATIIGALAGMCLFDDSRIIGTVGCGVISGLAMRFFTKNKE